MSVPDISGRALAALGTSELRHLAPVYAGDTLYTSSRVPVASFTRSVLLLREDADQTFDSGGRER
jgi:acyl dehydratase